MHVCAICVNPRSTQCHMQSSDVSFRSPYTDSEASLGGIHIAKPVEISAHMKRIEAEVP